MHHEPWTYGVDIKPLYSQSTGTTFDSYFSMNRQKYMNVREDNLGLINSLWFKVVSSNPTFYNSTISFEPTRKTFGALLYAIIMFPYQLALTIDTALVTAKNSVGFQEQGIQNLGTTEYVTVSQSLAAGSRYYGRVVKSESKTGLDDIQIKIIRYFQPCACSAFNIYALLGIPTGAGAKSKVLFEPLVGSKHVQLGLGAYYAHDLGYKGHNEFSFVSELKWRYAFSAKERRLFDITENGPWSRFMLLVQESNKYAPFFASNALGLQVSVTPKNSLDLYLALHIKRDQWRFDVGYDFWFRSQEHIALSSLSLPNNLGIADLLGITAFNPQSASTATISQGVAYNANQMVSDTTFIALTSSDLNVTSAQAPRSLSNSLYTSLAYVYDGSWLSKIGLNVAYEVGTNNNVPNNVTAWLTAEAAF